MLPRSSALLLLLPTPAAAAATTSCSTPGLPLLDELGRRHGTDKSTTNHAFTVVYAHAFERIRQSATRVLEVGVFYGSSIRMWREYFSKAEVVGVDPFAGLLGHGVRFPEPRRFLNQWQRGEVGDRVKLIEADQADTRQLRRTVSEVQTTGGLFDVIIDDGSHKHRDQQQTLGFLFPLVKPGGVFVIEDIHTSLQGKYDQPRLGNRTTLMMVERWQAGGPITSPFMTAEQMAYVSAWLDGCLRVVPPGMRSTLAQTCLCWKRTEPRPWPPPPGEQPSERPSLLGRLYSDEDATIQAGAAKVKPRADRGCTSSKVVPRVFQGR